MICKPLLSQRRRRGFSYLEMQVSLGLFMIALTGLGPLTVMHSRQLASMQSRLDPDNTYYVTPSPDEWARKLGAEATISLAPLPDPTPTVPPPIPEHSVTMDDSDPDYEQVNRGDDDWWSVPYSAAYADTIQLNFPDNKGDKGVWVFKELPPATYKVYATWPPLKDGASKAEFSIYDDGTLLKSTHVKQTNPPANKVDEDGSAWKKLANIDFAGTELRVELTDKGADGYIVLDAVKVVRHGYEEVQVVSIFKPHGANYVESEITLGEEKAPKSPKKPKKPSDPVDADPEDPKKPKK